MDNPILASSSDDVLDGHDHESPVPIVQSSAIVAVNSCANPMSFVLGSGLDSIATGFGPGSISFPQQTWFVASVGTVPGHVAWEVVVLNSVIVLELDVNVAPTEGIIRGYQQLLGDVPDFDGATVAEQQDPETTDQQEAMQIVTEKEDSCKT